MTYDEDILLFAVRYALGRQTFAVPTVTAEVRRVLDKLSRRARCVMAADIGRYIVVAKPDHTMPTWITCFETIESTLDEKDKEWLYCIGGGVDRLELEKAIKGEDYAIPY